MHPGNRLPVYLPQWADPNDVKVIRESNRYGITLVMALIVAGTIIWAFTATGTGRWENTKDLLDIVFPVEAALLGTLIAFYVVEVG